jgi:hypothetical protein
MRRGVSGYQGGDLLLRDTNNGNTVSSVDLELIVVSWYWHLSHGVVKINVKGDKQATT